MLRNIRDWFIDQTPIDSPKIHEIQIEGVIDEFGSQILAGQIEVPSISTPRISTQYASIVFSQHAEDLTLHRDVISLAHEDMTSFPLIDVIELPSDKLSSLPDHIDVFDALGKPNRAGKQFGEDLSQKDEEKQIPSQIPLIKKECIHGLPENMCDDCSQKRLSHIVKPKKQSMIPTINVFDLLLPLLQPPIKFLLEQPLLFPPGRRPFPFQIEGIQFLSERTAALLGDEMGLGKTIQAIVGMQVLFRNRKIRNVLVVCPLSVLGTWEREIRKWAPELVVLKIRGDQNTRKILWKSPSVVYLTTYETLRNDSNRHWVVGNKFDLVVLDEIQKIKNPTSQTSIAIRKLGPSYRWGLSGTPLENKVGDVIAIFRFLDQELFKLEGNTLQPFQVRGYIKPFFLRRKIADVRSDLPKKHKQDVWLDLTEEQMLAYSRAEQLGRLELFRPEATRIHVFALINSLKQICNLDNDSGTSCKVDYLCDHLDTILEGGYKALVFSQFPQKTLTVIKDDLEVYDPELYHGSMSGNQRDQLVDRFQTEEYPKVLLMSVRAGGLGITLTKANYVFHFDHWWNPAISLQAEARAYRIGQENPVFVYSLFTRDTIEERVHKILAEKQLLFDEVIDELTTTDALDRLSDEDLFGLFDLPVPEKLKKSSQAKQRTQSLTTIKDGMDQLDPYQFEDLIAAYYERRGFVVDIGKRSKDGGIDLVARRATDIGRDELIIQCKHYPEGTVGEPVVRALIGSWQDNPEATRAVLVTSGRFSKEAVNLASRHNIDLLDGVSLTPILWNERIDPDIFHG